MAAAEAWRFGPFEGVRRLGDGPRIVWLAVDTRTDRPVTLKVAPVGADYEARFDRECAASRALRGTDRSITEGNAQGLRESVV